MSDTPMEESAAAVPEAAPAVEAAAAVERQEAENSAPDTDSPVASEPQEGATPPDSTAAPADGDETKKPRRARNPRAASLYRALRSGRTVQGVVEKVIKGGYEVRAAKTRAFCPHSQIDLHRETDPERHVGKTYPFKVTQIRRGGDDVVVSRRQVLEATQAEEAGAVKATLIEGAVTQGHVAGLADFGAFVDLGAGVMGLVHVSELSHDRTPKVSDILTQGETVQVKILKIDDAKGRISLSIRQATEDPWTRVAEQFRAGEVYPGEVSRLADFGAFVSLAPGVEALAPFSELPPAPDGWRGPFERGEQKQWLVLSVNPPQRRISVIPPVEGHVAGAPLPEVGAKVSGQVQRHERFGVFLWLGPGRVGLMPNAWTGIPRDELVRRLPVGKEVEVEVVEVADEGRRIRLAREGAHTAAPSQRRKSPGRKPRPAHGLDRRPAPQPTHAVSDGPFGTLLADKLKAALNRADP